MIELVRRDDLDVLMQKVRANIEARKLQAGAQAFADIKANTVPLSINLMSKRYNVMELLTSYDAVFMRSAHLAIMGQEPNGEMAAQLLQQLRLGQISRIDVIDSLMATHDAHTRGVVILGLRRQRFYDRIRRSYALRKAAALARIARNIPRLASYMRQVISRVDGAECKVRQLELQLVQANQKLQNTEVLMQQQIQALSSRVNALQVHINYQEPNEGALSICEARVGSSMRAGL